MTGRTVLVIDDDRAILEFVSAALEDEGYRTLTAVNGSAVALAEREQPELILLDLTMREMDGIEMSRRLRGLAATVHIPIVAMSAHVRQAAPASLQADDWLAKPFDLDQLYAVVARWVHRA